MLDREVAFDMFWSEDERDVDEVEDVDVVIFFFVAFLLFFTFAFDFGLNVDLFCAAAAFSFAFFFDLVSMIIISTNLGRGRVSLFPNFFLFLVSTTKFAWDTQGWGTVLL
jgi:hypothetical protein